MISGTCLLSGTMLEISGYLLTRAWLRRSVPSANRGSRRVRVLGGP